MSDCLVDVLVVGAGPAGAASAICLTRLGYQVLLVDRAHFPRAKTCGEYLSPGVVRSLQSIGSTGVLEDREAKQVPGMEIVSPRGHILRVSYEQSGAVLSAYTLPRRRLDNALVRDAQRAGADVLEGFVAQVPVIEHGVVRGVQGIVGGETRYLRARLTIFADGARSAMARHLGLTRKVRWPSRIGLMAYYAGPAGLHDGYGQMHIARSGYCGIAPLSDNRFNVALVTPFHPGRHRRESASIMYDRWIAEHPVLRHTLLGCTRITPVRGVAPIGARVTRSYVPGALLVGDAAGFFDPFTGEGIYRALESAQLAASVAHRALLSGDVSECMLRKYDEMRRTSFTWKQRTTSLVQLFVQIPALADYALPKLAARPVPRGRLSLVLGDVADARQFFNANMLWAALRP